MGICPNCGAETETAPVEGVRCRSCGSTGSPEEEKTAAAAPAPPASGQDRLAHRRGGPVRRETFGARYARQVHSRNISSGRHALIIVAVGSALWGAVALTGLLRRIEEPGGGLLLWLLLLAVGFGPSVVFVGLWYWARHHPLAACGLGLALYSLFVAVELVMTSGGSLFTLGSFIELVILVVLFHAVKSAIAFRKLSVRSGSA